jgi:hypothetical protein
MSSTKIEAGEPASAIRDDINTLPHLGLCCYSVETARSLGGPGVSSVTVVPSTTWMF